MHRLGWRSERGMSSVIGNLLLVAVVVVLGITISLLALTVVDGLGVPTAEGSFEYERTSAGLRMTPTALGTDVAVLLNGEQVTTFDADEAGSSVLLPTAPGDRIVVVSRDGEQSVLVTEEIDQRSEIGDFIAYYTFESGSGRTLVDRSGNDNDGALIDDNTGDGESGPSWAGCGLRFDGDDDQVSVQDISAPKDTSEFTVAVTYRQTGNDDDINQLVEHQFASGGNEWFLETTDSGTGQYGMDFAAEYPNNVISSNNSYALGDRHVVVGTYDGGTDTYRLYIDGAPVATGSHNRAVNMGDMRIGRDFESTNQYLDGDVCEARLYYTALDGDEVAVISDAMS
jgi:flagellin-like protein